MSKSALETWKEKLSYLQNEEALATDAAQKFAISKQIEEARQRVRQLETGLRAGPEAHDKGAATGRREPNATHATFPAWAPKAGVVFGGMTLAFFMALVLWSIAGAGIPTESRFLIAAVLALGVALSMAFIGGDAAVKGQIALPWIKDHPASFSIVGGVAVFFMILLVSQLAYVAPGLEGGSRSVDFEATPQGTPFAVQSVFRGRVTVDSKLVAVRVSEVELSMPRALPAGDSQYVQSISVSIAGGGGSGTGPWKEIQRSTSSQEVGRWISVGEPLQLDGFVLEIPRTGISLQERWLVFNLGVSASVEGSSAGYVHSRTSATLFATLE